MAENQFGPWEVVPATEHHGFYVVNDWGRTVCDLYTMSNPSLPSTRNGGESFPIEFDPDHAGEHARLIAAAPEAVAFAEAVADESDQPHLRAAAREWLAKAGVA